MPRIRYIDYEKYRYNPIPNQFIEFDFEAPSRLV